MTGQGGWPLNVFSTPRACRSSAAPTSRPSRATGCRASARCWRRVAEAWRHAPRRDPRRRRRARARGCSAPAQRCAPSEEILSPAVLDEAERTLAAQFDPTFGGFGGAPKFPPSSRARVPDAPHRRAAQGSAGRDGRRWSTTTLERMARGGIYDQVGGGFARYSVDAHWLVPHFEKMLYDNALLARALPARLAADRHAALPPGVRGDARLGAARDARPRGRLLLRARRRLRGRGGPVLRVDGGRAARSARRRRRGAAAPTGASTAGPNFEGRSILHVAGEDDVDPEVLARGAPRSCTRRARSACGRARRQAPDGLERADDRGAGRRRRGARARPTTSRPRAHAPTFLLEHDARRRDGRLLRTYKDGRASLNAYLEDHAFLVEALLVLYEATFETRWFTAARDAGRRRSSSASPTRTARLLHDTACDQEDLIVRPKSSRTTRSPRATRPPPRRCCGWRRSRASARYEQPRGRGVPRAAPGRRPAIRRRSGSCCRRCTSTSPRGARWRWSATP